MAVGLTGSRNTLQSLIEQVLVGLTWETTVPSLDDCIILSSTAEEHIQKLKEVLERFRSANLKKNVKKCILSNSYPFFRYVFSKNVLKADLSENTAVQKFPIPANPIEVKSFLRLCSYYSTYVENFVEMALPLHKTG